MRLTLISTALVISTSGALMAQEVAQDWTEFANLADRFTCNFPGLPKVTDTTYTSERGAELRGRIYSATQGPSRYSATVVDYGQVQRILTEKSKSCPAGAEPCLGGPGDEGHWKADLRGAIIYASWKLMQRDAKVTSFVWGFVDLVEGLQMQLTNNDKSRTFAGIYMHENKLYLLEGTVPAGYPEPALFQQSLGWLDENGVGLRYRTYYSNNYPAPPRVNRALNPGQGRIDAAGSNSASNPGGTAGQTIPAP